jgi:hypothetical protein
LNRIRTSFSLLFLLFLLFFIHFEAHSKEVISIPKPKDTSFQGYSFSSDKKATKGITATRNDRIRRAEQLADNLLMLSIDNAILTSSVNSQSRVPTMEEYARAEKIKIRARPIIREIAILWNYLDKTWFDNYKQKSILAIQKGKILRLGGNSAVDWFSTGVLRTTRNMFVETWKSYYGLSFPNEYLQEMMQIGSSRQSYIAVRALIPVHEKEMLKKQMDEDYAYNLIFEKQKLEQLQASIAKELEEKKIQAEKDKIENEQMEKEKLVKQKENEQSTIDYKNQLDTAIAKYNELLTKLKPRNNFFGMNRDYVMQFVYKNIILVLTEVRDKKENKAGRISWKNEVAIIYNPILCSAWAETINSDKSLSNIYPWSLAKDCELLIEWNQVRTYINKYAPWYEL